MAKTRRAYEGAGASTTLNGGFAAGATTLSVVAATGWPYGSDPFFIVVEPGTANEEKILVTRANSGDLNLTVSGSRGADGTTDLTHADGSTVYPVFTATDADEANELTSAWTTKGDIVTHGAATFERLPVGTDGYVLTADSAASGGLAWGQVDTDQIATNAITADKIAADSVTGSELASNSVEATHIANGAVEYDKLDSVVQDKFPRGIVGTLSASGSYTSDAMRDSVTVTGTNRLVMIVAQEDSLTQWEVRRSGAGTLIRTDKTDELDVFGSGAVRIYGQASTTTYELWNDGSTGGYSAQGVAYIVDLGPS